MTLTFNQAIAMIKGATYAIETVKALIAAGKGPTNPNGTPLTAEDVDRHIAEAKAEVLKVGDEADARIKARHTDG